MYTGYLPSCPLCFSIIWASVLHISKFKSICGEVLMGEQKATRNIWTWKQTVTIMLNGLREGEKRDEWKDRGRKGKDGWSNHQAEQIG